MNEGNKQFLADNWWKFAMFAMLGIVMYWTYIVIQPTQDLVEQNQKIIDSNAEQANQINATIQKIDNETDVILSNQENNTAEIKWVLNETSAIKNQVVILVTQVKELSDLLQILQNQNQSQIQLGVIESKLDRIEGRIQNVTELQMMVMNNTRTLNELEEFLRDQPYLY
jgi:archaellum component FlaC